MFKKQVISQVVIVEGKTDSAKLKNLFDVETIETNGLNLTNKKLKEIKEIAKAKEIILFLDPDGPGEKIRKKIMEHIPEAYNCFVKKEDIKSNKKIGIAEASNESILNAFANIVKFNTKNESISWTEYLDLDLNSKKARLFMCNKLNISYCNHKQLFKRLNMLNINFNQAKELLK